VAARDLKHGPLKLDRIKWSWRPPSRNTAFVAKLRNDLVGFGGVEPDTAASCLQAEAATASRNRCDGALNANSKLLLGVARRW
jgi:hypothetical protein